MISQIEKITQNEVTVANFKYSGAGFIPKPNGWREYSYVDVKKNGGSMITEGDFTKVQIYLKPTTVQYSPTQTIQVPGPDPMWPAKSTFTYPAAPQFDLVVVQCLDGVPDIGDKAKINYLPMLATATSEADCQTIELNGAKNLFIAFNDLVGAYYDNGGEVKVMVKLIK